MENINAVPSHVNYIHRNVQHSYRVGLPRSPLNRAAALGARPFMALPIRSGINATDVPREYRRCKVLSRLLAYFPRRKASCSFQAAGRRLRSLVSESPSGSSPATAASMSLGESKVRLRRRAT